MLRSQIEVCEEKNLRNHECCIQPYDYYMTRNVRFFVAIRPVVNQMIDKRLAKFQTFKDHHYFQHNLAFYSPPCNFQFKSEQKSLIAHLSSNSRVKRNYKQITETWKAPFWKSEARSQWSYKLPVIYPL